MSICLQKHPTGHTKITLFIGIFNIPALNVNGFNRLFILNFCKVMLGQLFEAGLVNISKCIFVTFTISLVSRMDKCFEIFLPWEYTFYNVYSLTLYVVYHMSDHMWITWHWFLSIILSHLHCHLAYNWKRYGTLGFAVWYIHLILICETKLQSSCSNLVMADWLISC